MLTTQYIGRLIYICIYDTDTYNPVFDLLNMPTTIGNSSRPQPPTGRTYGAISRVKQNTRIRYTYQSEIE
jgi:hypothetical protein